MTVVPKNSNHTSQETCWTCEQTSNRNAVKVKTRQHEVDDLERGDSLYRRNEIQFLVLGKSIFPQTNGASETKFTCTWENTTNVLQL